MSDNKDLVARLIELEQRLEFQDETITQLNDQLARHQRQLFELSRKFELVIQRLREGPDQLADPGEEPPPPHY